MVFNSPPTNRFLVPWAQLGITERLISDRGFPLFAEAVELVTAEVSPAGQQFLMTPPAAVAWKEMKAAADSEGIDIHIVSAYRSVQRQTELISQKLDAGQTLETILKILAPPGCSEHHTGRAVDLGSGQFKPLMRDFESTPAFAWLTRSAARFGFELSFPEGNGYGYDYEPWHWCFSAAGNQ